MKKGIFLLFVLFIQVFSAQIKQNTYALHALDDLLTEDVKKIIAQKIASQPTVFLGESVHYSGSDFLAKAEFVKYLVNEHGYKDIAFESDFFALWFDHDKRNLYRMWSASDQCANLMEFLKKNKVTIWGFDNRMASPYSRKEFTTKLSAFLKSNEIRVDEQFLRLTDTLIKNEYNSPKTISEQEVAYLNKVVLCLLDHEKVKSDLLWTQLLESYKSSVELYTVNDNSNDDKRVIIRDKQMAKNLDFLIKQNPGKKFMVWLANAHMSKNSIKEMRGITMGYQFRQLHQGISYHVAFGSVTMPSKKNKKTLLRAAKNSNNILSYLPSTHGNYFMDTSAIIQEAPNLQFQLFNDLGIFNLYRKKSDLLAHYDALVFIGNGIEASYTQKLNKTTDETGK